MDTQAAQTSTAPSSPPTTTDITKKSKKRFRILLAFSIAGVVLLKMSFILFFIGMLPAAVAYIVDNDQKKYVSMTVAALNFSGVFPYMMDIFMRGGTFGAIESKLADPVVWFVMYGSAAMGWIIVFSSPVIAAAVLQGIYKGRILHLESLQKKSIEEWGEEVASEE